MRSDSALARSVRSPRVVNIADLRERARRRLPALVFDYIDGAAEDEVTLANNRAAFTEVTFRPRQCVAVPACDLRTTVLGTEFALPFLLAPVGNCRTFYPMGDAQAARAAHAAGTAYILSTFSGTRIEDVRAATPGPLWYQLYVPGGRAVAEAAIARAKAAGYTVLVVTIDTPVAGMRERDVRRGAKQVLGGGRAFRICGSSWCGRAGCWTISPTAPLGCSPTWSCRASARCPAATSARCWRRRW
jgi:L-lactate dehydrogenase (cytochrome)